MGERLLCKQEVVGSIPITSTSQMSEDRCQKTEDRCQKTEDRRQKTGVRGQRDRIEVCDGRRCFPKNNPMYLEQVVDSKGFLRLDRFAKLLKINNFYHQDTKTRSNTPACAKPELRYGEGRKKG